jgi:hypothetical protein
MTWCCQASVSKDAQVWSLDEAGHSTPSPSLPPLLPLATALPHTIARHWPRSVAHRMPPHHLPYCRLPPRCHTPSPATNHALQLIVRHRVASLPHARAQENTSAGPCSLKAWPNPFSSGRVLAILKPNRIIHKHTSVWIQRIRHAFNKFYVQLLNQFEFITPNDWNTFQYLYTTPDAIILNNRMKEPIQKNKFKYKLGPSGYKSAISLWTKWE